MIIDGKTNRAARIHTSNDKSIEFAAQAIRDAFEKIGISPSDRQYIQDEIAIVVLTPRPGEHVKDKWAQDIAQLLIKASVRAGIRRIGTNRNAAWGFNSRIRFLIDEKIVMALSQGGDVLHTVSLGPILKHAPAIIRHNQDKTATTERYEKITTITTIALAPVKDPKMIEEMMAALERFCQDDDLAVRRHAQQKLIGLKSSLKMLQRRQKEIDSKMRFLKTIDLAPDFDKARLEHIAGYDRFPNLPEIDEALSRLVAEDIERNLATKTLSYHINAAKNLDVKALIRAIQRQRKLTPDWKIFIVISNINESHLTEASLVLKTAKDKLPCPVVVQPVCMNNEQEKHMVRFKEALAKIKEYPGFFNGTICNLGGAAFTFMEPRPLLTMFWQQISAGGVDTN